MRSEEAGISMRLGSWPEKWAACYDEDTDFVAALISSARESVMIVSASCAGSSPQCACTVFKLRDNKREKLEANLWYGHNMTMNKQTVT